MIKSNFFIRHRKKLIILGIITIDGMGGFMNGGEIPTDEFPGGGGSIVVQIKQKVEVV